MDAVLDYEDAFSSSDPEPFIHLDDESKEQVLKTIQSLKKVGKTALFVTHNETELSLCNSVYNIKNQEFVKIK